MGKPDDRDDAADAARYRYLRQLGLAPNKTHHLDNGTHLKGDPLDAWVDWAAGPGGIKATP